jgi:uroporphyrin-III C-methyltransferase
MLLPEAIALKLPSFEPGTVWLVGAGPRRTGLLMLLALHAFQQAGVIDYDALASNWI